MRTAAALAPRTAATAGDHLLTGLKRTSAAYVRLTRATRANRPRAYARSAAAAAVRRGEEQVRQALAALAGRL